jgi:predicted transposase YbfD/YdcC
MVSAWAMSVRLVLGQLRVEDKSNEITAVPTLLGLLDLTGCVVTTDALSCQKETVSVIVSQQADYVLTLKDNHAHLYEDVAVFFEQAQSTKFDAVTYQKRTTRNKGHGRIEERRYWLLNLPEGLAWEEERQAWKGLQSIGRVESLGQTRKENGTWETSRQIRYFLSSLDAREKANGRVFARSVRGHWGIENRLHWVLDIAFREDDCRLRKEHAAENFAVLRHLSINLLHRDRQSKIGIKNRRLRAAWDEKYLSQLLTT